MSPRSISYSLLLGSLCVGAFACSKPASATLDAPLAEIATETAHAVTAAIPEAPTPVAKKIDRAAVRARLADARKHHIEQLDAYWKKGVFPINTAKPKVANIFRDPVGHLCAVANMVWLDGDHDLVDATAKDNNFVRVADVDSGPLHDWTLESGFTREEVAMIQVPYMPPDNAFVRRQAAIAQEYAAAEAERARVKNHLKEVESRLVDDTEQSLDIATDKLIADPDHARELSALGIADAETASL